MDYEKCSEIEMGKDDETVRFDVRDDDYTIQYKGYLKMFREKRPMNTLNPTVQEYLMDGFTVTSTRNKL